MTKVSLDDEEHPTLVLPLPQMLAYLETLLGRANGARDGEEASTSRTKKIPRSVDSFITFRNTLGGCVS